MGVRSGRDDCDRCDQVPPVSLSAHIGSAGVGKTHSLLETLAQFEGSHPLSGGNASLL